LTSGDNSSVVTTQETIGVWLQGQIEFVGCVRINTVGSFCLTQYCLVGYSGTCDKLTCVAANDDASSLVHTSEILVKIGPNVCTRCSLLELETPPEITQCRLM
jgi:hypothetical protein